MKNFLVKVKSEGAETEITNLLLVECDTYATAEQVGYKWGEENCNGSFYIDSVVKSQIKEVHDIVAGDLFFFLIKYEFGLEAKPEKSNLVTTADTLMDVCRKAVDFLTPNTSALFIPEIKKLDVEEFIPFAEVKEMLNIRDEEEVQEEVEEEAFDL